jgi:hypothetical protein
MTQAKSASLFISPSLDDDRLSFAPMIYTEAGTKGKREVRAPGLTPCAATSNFRPQH